jgi:hypothetical protein
MDWRNDPRMIWIFLSLVGMVTALVGEALRASALVVLGVPVMIVCFAIAYGSGEPSHNSGTK